MEEDLKIVEVSRLYEIIGKLCMFSENALMRLAIEISAVDEDVDSKLRDLRQRIAEEAEELFLFCVPDEYIESAIAPFCEKPKDVLDSLQDQFLI